MRRPIDADAAEVVEAGRDGAVASAEGHEEVHPQPGDGGQVREAGGAACQFGEARLRFRQRAREELAFGPLQLEREGELVPALPRPPATGPHRRRDSSAPRRRRSTPWRACPRSVELGQLLALLARGDQGRATVELTDDLEDALLDRLRRRVRSEQPPDPQMRGGPLAFGVSA